VIGLLGVLVFIAANVIGHVVVGLLDEGSLRAWWTADQPPARYRKGA
jgi:hypothetical protein